MVRVRTPLTEAALIRWRDKTMVKMTNPDDANEPACWFELSDNGVDVIEHSEMEDGTPYLDGGSLIDPRGADWDLGMVVFAVLKGLIDLEVTAEVVVEDGAPCGERFYDSALDAFLRAGVPATERVLTFGAQVERDHERVR